MDDSEAKEIHISLYKPEKYDKRMGCLLLTIPLFGAVFLGAAVIIAGGRDKSLFWFFLFSIIFAMILAMITAKARAHRIKKMVESPPVGYIKITNTELIIKNCQQFKLLGATNFSGKIVLKNIINVFTLFSKIQGKKIKIIFRDNEGLLQWIFLKDMMSPEDSKKFLEIVNQRAGNKMSWKEHSKKDFLIILIFFATIFISYLYFKYRS